MKINEKKWCNRFTSQPIVIDWRNRSEFCMSSAFSTIVTRLERTNRHIQLKSFTLCHDIIHLLNILCFYFATILRIYTQSIQFRPYKMRMTILSEKLNKKKTPLNIGIPNSYNCWCSWVPVSKCMCVCACVHEQIDTHTHTHIHRKLNEKLWAS